MNLRIHTRWAPYIDPCDPAVMWRQVEVLQFRTDESSGWRDVPREVEGKLTDEMKRARLPVDQHWRFKWSAMRDNDLAPDSR